MIVYASRTGNVRDIVSRLDKSITTMELDSNVIVAKPYFLFTYTDGLGEVPQEVMDFLLSSEANRINLKGVIASGNTNFGEEKYCGSAIEISRWLSVPIIRKIDLRGNQEDIATINASYKKMIAGDIS